MNVAQFDREHEADYAKVIVNALYRIYDEVEPLADAEVWATMASGLDTMPPPSKRKWIAWAEKRAAAGDERFIRLFTTIAIMRMTG